MLQNQPLFAVPSDNATYKAENNSPDQPATTWDEFLVTLHAQPEGVTFQCYLTEEALKPPFTNNGHPRVSVYISDTYPLSGKKKKVSGQRGVDNNAHFVRFQPDAVTRLKNNFSLPIQPPLPNGNKISSSVDFQFDGVGKGPHDLPIVPTIISLPHGSISGHKRTRTPSQENFESVIRLLMDEIDNGAIWILIWIPVSWF